MLQTSLVLASANADGSSAFGVIGDWAVTVMNGLGAWGVGLLVFLENLFPPIPSEIVLPLAGFTAGSPEGTFTWVQALIWATIGSVVGAYVLYGLGAWLGHDRTVWLLAKIPLVDKEDIEKTIAWFNKHGYWTVFFGRMVPLFRSLISIPAGIARMSWWRFGLLTFLGSAIWNTIFIYGGYILGSNWQVMETFAGWLQYAVIAAAVIFVLWYVVHKIRQHRRSRNAN